MGYRYIQRKGHRLTSGATVSFTVQEVKMAFNLKSWEKTKGKTTIIKCTYKFQSWVFFFEKMNKN